MAPPDGFLHNGNVLVYRVLSKERLQGRGHNIL